MTLTTAIARDLWSRGRLLPPVLGSPYFTSPGTVQRSITQFQRDLRIPIRLASFIALSEGWPAEAWAPPLREVAPPERLASDLLSPAEHAHALECVRAAATLRPAEPALIYGQRFATAQSAVCRAAIMHGRLSGSNPRVLFLGDDDLASIAFAAIRPDARITVVDIDPQVLAALQEMASVIGVEIEFVARDLFSPNEAPLPAVYDCFVADPYPTPDASFELAFIRAGFCALRGTPDAFGLVTFAPSHKHGRFGRILLDRLGCSVRETIANAVEYDVIDGEFTTPETEYLRSVLRGERGMSHQKSYVVAASGQWREDVRFDVGGWLQALRNHELSARLGGSPRLDAELSSTAPEAWQAGVPNGLLSPVMIEATPLLADLVDSENAAASLRDLLLEGSVDEARAKLQVRLAEPLSISEVEALWRAVCTGATTVYDAPGEEWELFVLARLYESYFRGYTAAAVEKAG